MDALFDFKNFQLRAHVAQNAFEALGRISAFQQRLLVFGLDAEVANELVGQIRGIVDRCDRRRCLWRNLRGDAHIVVQGRVDGTHQRLDLGRVVAGLLHLLDFDLEELVLARIAHDPRTLLALQQRLDGAIRQPQDLNHHTKRPNRVDVVRTGVRDAGVILGGQQNRFLGNFSSL